MKTKTPYFSILIPVYNVENYIKECLESVMNQTFPNYEVIMIDDGSTDRSREICQQYVEKDTRFHLKCQMNKGLLQTRRRLYQLMEGSYAVCLDSDDYKPADTLQKCYDYLQEYRCDMLIGRMCNVNSEGKIIGETPKVFKNKQIFLKENKNELLNYFCVSGMMNSLVIKVVKKEIIDRDNDYSSFVDVKGEDLLQSLALLKNANSILYVDHIMYYYRGSINSRSKNFKIKDIRDINMVFKLLFDFCKENCDINTYQKVIHRYLVKQRYMLGQAISAKYRYAILLEEMKTAEVIEYCNKYFQKVSFKKIFDKITLFCISGKNLCVFKCYMKVYLLIRKIIIFCR